MLFMHHVRDHGSQIFFGHPKFLYARWMFVKYQGLAKRYLLEVSVGAVREISRNCILIMTSCVQERSISGCRSIGTGYTTMAGSAAVLAVADFR